MQCIGMDKIILNPIVLSYNMAKELGQIHTVNKSLTFTSAFETATPFVVGDVDIPGELTSQLQRMIRAGQYFKTVGIDMTLDLDSNLNQSAVVSGEIRYYAPTRGRCEAFRGAFKAMADQMSIQGISMRDNKLYDFRAPINTNAQANFNNQATLDGTQGLCLNNPGFPGAGIFQVHNASVRPVYEGSKVFDEGFDTLLAAGAARTDFVLNDVAPFTGNEHIASLEYETIPFQLALSTTPDEIATATFQWRPDPALYQAVLCGQYQIILTDLQTETGILPPTNLDLNLSIMVSGWKSIMGNPDKKNKKKKSSSKRMTSKKTRK